MNLKMKTPLWVTLLLIVGIASFKLGIYTGLYQFQLYDSPYKAFMAASQLKLLENQQLNLIKSIQEPRLTEEIVNYGKSLEHGNSWLLWPYFKDDDYYLSELFGDRPSREEFMKKAISYRRTHPIDFPYDLSECNGKNKNEEPCKTVLDIKLYYDKAMQLIQ
jgi:hypothetical protein